MASDVSKDDWGLRAVACELLAYTLRFPTAELVETAASGEWAEAAQEVAGALGLGLSDGFCAAARSLCPAQEQGEGAGTQTSEALLHAMRAEATRLFVGAPKPACSPYEGVWRAGDDGVNPLLFVNPHSMAVERFCRSCGLVKPQGTNEPLDHVATELELLQLLAMVEAGMAQASVPVDGLPGGSAAGAYNAFMRDHALVWVPRFAERLAAESRLPFYRAAAELLGLYFAAAQ